MNMRTMRSGSSPFFDFSKLEDEFDRIFGPSHTPAGLRSVPRGTFPAMNVYESEDHTLVTAEIPGLDPEKLEVTLHNNVLTVAGDRPHPKTIGDEEAKKLTVHRNERSFGSFRRSLSLPGRVDPEHVEARYENGILAIRIAKAQEMRTRKIEVTTHS